MKTHITVCLLLIASYVYAQTDTLYYTAEDSILFGKYLTYMEEKDSLPFDSLLMKTADFFLGTPYVGATLEQEPEGLVINLRELDCFTFVENVIALSRTIAEGEPAFEKYCNHLKLIRYREGNITGYTDRLHYTSDWLYENDRKQILKYPSGEIGGQPYTFNLYFMSSHPDSYRPLKADTSLIPVIKETEQQINARTSFYYIIPKHEIDSFAVHIQSGDVVAFVTSIPGLDISHVGIAMREGETLTFVHASSVAKEVIVNKESLKEYVENGKNRIGIMTARPLPPTSNKEPDQNISKANLTPIL
ncbi:MAG: DUF1460 domain-containing protein [Tannerellaceae bacterium]|jgi:hypothetical protein|nr:DUF1460 domain-containing protein [Tannerellaceae bacterium]